jgi:hypothetical protein
MFDTGDQEDWILLNFPKAFDSATPTPLSSKTSLWCWGQHYQMDCIPLGGHVINPIKPVDDEMTTSVDLWVSS